MHTQAHLHVSMSRLTASKQLRYRRESDGPGRKHSRLVFVDEVAGGFVVVVSLGFPRVLHPERLLVKENLLWKFLQLRVLAVLAEFFRPSLVERILSVGKCVLMPQQSV